MNSAFLGWGGVGWWTEWRSGQAPKFGDSQVNPAREFAWEFAWDEFVWEFASDFGH